MTLDTILEQVENSSSDDWHKFSYPTPYFPFPEHGDLPDWHRTLTVFKPDIDISLAFGVTLNATFQEPWVEQFSDPHATSVIVVLRYRGVPVYEWTFVTVDGGRYYVPLPEPPKEGKYQISADRLPFARLMFDLSGRGGSLESVEQVLQRAGIIIVE